MALERTVERKRKMQVEIGSQGKSRDAKSNEWTSGEDSRERWGKKMLQKLERESQLVKNSTDLHPSLSLSWFKEYLSMSFLTLKFKGWRKGKDSEWCKWERSKRKKGWREISSEYDGSRFFIRISGQSTVFLVPTTFYFNFLLPFNFHFFLSFLSFLSSLPLLFVQDSFF